MVVKQKLKMSTCPPHIKINKKTFDIMKIMVGRG
jgi:hypothetical protein